MALVEVCGEKDIPVGEMKVFKVEGNSIVVYHLEDGYYATQSLCSHTFGPLRFGKIIDGEEIQCPVHRARFDIRTGKVVRWANFPPGVQLLNIVRKEKELKTYPVKAKKGKVFVDV